MFDAFANQFARAGTGLGSLAGGALGAASDVLSAPRRGLLALLNGVTGMNIPDRGNEAIGQWTGMDPDSFGAHALGFGLEMATDPLTYAGGFLGRLGGRALGGAADAAALARGPGYAGGAEKLAQAIGESGSASTLAQKLAGSAEAGRVLAELPEGSRLLSGSNNALAFKTPAGDVARIAGGEALPASRAAVPEMLQPTRNMEVGNWRVERVPFAEQVGDRDLFAHGYDELAGGLRDQGLRPADLHPGNVGVYGGRPVAIDPGAVGAMPGGQLPTAASLQAREPSAPMRWLLDLLGADRRLRANLAAPRSVMTSALPTSLPRPVPAPSVGESRLARMLSGTAG